ncbi:hypothetical protein Vafri_70, partial [Volvox africanus]
SRVGSQAGTAERAVRLAAVAVVLAAAATAGRTEFLVLTVGGGSPVRCKRPHMTLCCSPVQSLAPSCHPPIGVGPRDCSRVGRTGTGSKVMPPRTAVAAVRAAAAAALLPERGCNRAKCTASLTRRRAALCGRRMEAQTCTASKGTVAAAAGTWVLAAAVAEALVMMWQHHLAEDPECKRCHWCIFYGTRCKSTWSCLDQEADCQPRAAQLPSMVASRSAIPAVGSVPGPCRKAGCRCLDPARSGYYDRKARGTVMGKVAAAVSAARRRPS